MAFGQASGPPASAQQIRHLESLLGDAGHGSFKEARHPLGLTQRQAAGKFTSQEASELIERLESSIEEPDEPDESGESGAESGTGDATEPRGGAGRPAERRTPSVSAEERAARRLLSRQEEAVVDLPSELLATELERRGWTCIPPPDWQASGPTTS